MTETPLFAFFLPSLSAGGAERVLMAISAEIARRGYRCDLVTAQAGGRWEEIIPSGVHRISLNRAKPLHAVPELVRYLRGARPAALLSSVLAANFAALMACRLAGATTRCIVREAYRAGEEIEASSAVTTIANKAALRCLYPRADAIVALSMGLASHIAEIARIPAGRIHVIPNPYLPRGAATREDRPAVTQDIEPLVLACGRLEAQKDFATLLRAFGLVKKRRKARLVILGEGSEHESLCALAASLGIEGDVTFQGYAPDPHAWMRRAHVFVSTSRCEGFPNVLLEALDCGCAVVSTESSDTVSEVLDGGRFGALVPVGDAAMIADRVLAILNGSVTYPNAQEHLRAYELNIIAAQYLTLLIGDPPRRSS